jgi:hypothetical protein
MAAAQPGLDDEVEADLVKRPGAELTGAANPLRGPDAPATRGMGVRPL